MGGVCSGYSVPKKVLLMGPKGSGKTTLLYGWCLPGQETMAVPTQSFNVEMVYGVRNGQMLLMWDISDISRRRQFYHGTEALVYLLDASELSNLQEVQADLRVLLRDRDMKGLPLLFVLSKADLNNMYSVPSIEKELDLENLAADRKYDWATIRQDEPATFQAALQKLCSLVYPK